MSKKCSVEGCNTDISSWMVKCKKHYEEEMNTQGVVEEPPKVPSHKVTMPPQQMMQAGKIVEAKVVMNKPEVSKLNLTDKERIEIREICLRCAIDLITKTEFEDRTFETLRGEIETLTGEFYLIITTI